MEQDELFGLVSLQTLDRKLNAIIAKQKEQDEKLDKLQHYANMLFEITNNKVHYSN